ncbi:MAG: MFS transporter [Lentisphaeria bacterium]|nr:MFS transporter [Lentisphaeria bacterium]
MNISEKSLRRRKSIILLLGVILTFFTSMSKILVPGPIYNHLQTELLFDPSRIAALGAVFMYAYAASQLLMGIYSDRYGGVRILLIGGGLFTVGSLCFPFCSNPWLMYGFRVVTGFGAGTVFLGVAKLLNDLFPAKFGLMLGIALLISYFGPVTGTVPMVWLISCIGWRQALFLPGAICFCAMAGILLLMRGTIKKTVPGQTFTPLFRMLKNRPMWLLCLSSALIFGVYYVLLTQVGQKCIEDFYHLDKYLASLCITLLSVIVALNNVAVNLLLKLTGGRRKPIYIGGTLLMLAGCLTGSAAFFWHLSVWCLVAAFLMLGIPAGFFSFYSMIAKELNPPEVTGLAVAVLNFSAFAFIALFGNISGFLLGCWKYAAKDGVFPGEAYFALFLFLTVSALLSVVIGAFVPETFRKKI